MKVKAADFYEPHTPFKIETLDTCCATGTTLIPKCWTPRLWPNLAMSSMMTTNQSLSCTIKRVS